MITVLRTSAVLLAGRRFWLLPLLPLVWLAVQALMLVAGMRPSLEPAAAQNSLIGVPVAVLAIFLGGRTITGELDQHSLEIAYTVPGGAHRVWLGKLAAAILMLLSSLVLLAAITYAFFTDFPVLQSLYGATQGVVFYLVAAMGFATLFRSDVAGSLATIGLLGLNSLLSSFRVSPFWNPLMVEEADAAQMLALSVQNRIGTALAIAAIVALTFVRAERRERMLSG
ncbi:MAG: hypothetical protein OXG81_16585 [Acidobacteria bacterium]|nr:hypothetical protein [Acidobacteriota bacterium]MCY3963894.1 hypothetical protein [Acidobacteriota bacterium]